MTRWDLDLRAKLAIAALGEVDPEFTTELEDAWDALHADLVRFERHGGRAATYPAEDFADRPLDGCWELPGVAQGSRILANEERDECLRPSVHSVANRSPACDFTTAFTDDACHTAPPRAVRTPSSMSTAAIARSERPAARSATIRLTT